MKRCPEARRRFKMDPRLPIEPFREWMDRRIASYPSEAFGDMPPNQLKRFARDLADHAPCRDVARWQRYVFRLRFESTTILESDADMMLCAIDDGTFLWDIWPDRQAAIEEGYRLRMPHAKRGIAA